MPALSFPASPPPGAVYTVGVRTWVWSGTIWELSATALSTGVVGANELAAGAVTTAKIATNAITASTLASGASNNYVLTADSSTATGTKWSVTAASGGLNTSTEGAVATMAIGA